MKFLIWGIFLLGTSNVVFTAPQSNYIVGDIIGDIIATLIKGIIESATSNITDPITISELDLSISLGSIASGTFSISDFTETGLKGFEISTLNVTTSSPANIRLIMDIPTVNINTNYDIDVLIASLIPIYGSGLANINFQNFQIDMSSGYEFNLFTQSLTVSDLSVLITLGDATFDVHGIINNEAFSVIISQILDDTVATFINNHSQLFSDIVSPILEDLINSLSTDSLTSQNTKLRGVSEEQVKTNVNLFVENFKSHPKFAELKL